MSDEFIREVTAGMNGGDEDSYRRFYDACFDKMYRHLLVRTRGDETLAQELAQLVLLRIARYVQPFKGESAFWAWIRQLCRSAHVDWLRRNARFSAQSSPEIFIEPTESASDTDEELLESLDQSIAQLDSAEKELLDLVYFKKQPHQKIALQLATTPKAVESKLARIRRKLRQTILENLNRYALI